MKISGTALSSESINAIIYRGRNHQRRVVSSVPTAFGVNFLVGASTLIMMFCIYEKDRNSGAKTKAGRKQTTRTGGSDKKRDRGEGGRACVRRTVRAAEDPGVEGRLAVEPVRDAEAAVHAQPPRPGVALLVAAAAAAVNAVSLVRAPHGLRPCPALQLQASAWAWLPRARCNSSSSAPTPSPSPPRGSLSRRSRAPRSGRDCAGRNAMFRIGLASLAYRSRLAWPNRG
jgi:hypothetical protein